MSEANDSQSTHADLLARHRAVVPSWLALYYEQPIELTQGEGCYVTDGEGNRYLDFFGGILTTMTGHCVPEVVAAIQEQAGRLVHSSTLYLNRPMIELAERIAELSGIPDAKVFFTPSGTEATDAALLLATTFRRSNEVLAMRNSYHGRSFGAMAVTGNRGWSASALTPLNVQYLHGAYPFRSPFRALGPAEYARACVADLEDVLTTATSGDVACLIAEPIQGVGGFTHPPDGLYGEFQAVLKRHGILYVSDEVQTGWGRTGDHFWGYEAHGVSPDIITFAKGLGNGLSIGGIVAGAELMDCIQANSISTFGGNPLVCAGALANLQYLLDHDLQRNARTIGTYMIDTLRESLSRCPVVGEIRGKGVMIGIELVGADDLTPNAGAAAKVLEQTRSRGLLIGRGGLYGNCLRIAPPLSVTREEAEEGLDKLIASIQ